MVILLGKICFIDIDQFYYFRSWSARRKFTKNKKHRKQLERPTLPDGTKLITFPVSSSSTAGSGSTTGDDNGQRPAKHWIMNPSGKSYVCILHEYVQHALKKQPTYKFKELGTIHYLIMHKM